MAAKASPAHGDRMANLNTVVLIRQIQRQSRRQRG
jgi:hypothetical protein